MAQRPRRKGADFTHPAMTYSKPKSLQRFQAGMVLVISTLLVAGLWTGGWFIAQAMVKAALTDWMTAEHSRGNLVSYEKLDLSGFPSRIKLDILAPKFKGLAFGKNVAWQGERLSINTRPWWPWTLHLQAPGVHELALPDQGLNFKGTVKAMTADLSPGESWPETLNVKLSKLTLKDENTTAHLTINDLSVGLKHNLDQDRLRMSVNANAVQLPLLTNLPLGNLIDTLDFTVIMNGVLAPEDLGNNLSQAIPRWQKRKGNLDVVRLNFKNGPFFLTTSGTLSLDDTLQPVGDFTAKMEGLFQVIEIMRLQGLVQPSDAVIATMALSAFSKRPKEGGPSTINLSVTAEHEILKLGPIKILQLPHFTWGIKPPKPAVKEPRNYKNAPPVY